MAVLLWINITAAILYIICYLAATLQLPPAPELWRNPPPVSVLKPVRGLDHDAEANFRSFFQQEYPSRWELIFSLESPVDPAVAVIQRLQQEYPEVAARIVFSRPHKAWTGKMANVIRAYAAAQFPLIVISDSDMRVEPDFLLRMVSPLRDQQIGLVGALPIYVGGNTMYSQALLVYAHLFGLCVAGMMTKLQVPGKFAAGNQAIRRRLVEDIGGLEAIAGYISEDLRLGLLVQKRGYRIVYAAMSSCPVGDIDSQELEQILSRYQLASRALFTPLYVFMYMLNFAHWMLLLVTVAYCLVIGPELWWLPVTGLLPLLTRSAVAWLLHRRWAGPVSFWRILAAVVLLDWSFFKTTLRNRSGNRIVWRDVQYEVLNDGRVQRLPAAGSGNQSHRILCK